MKTRDLFCLAQLDLKFIHPSLSSATVLLEKDLEEKDKEGLIHTFLILSRAWQWQMIRRYSQDLFEDVLLSEYSKLKWVSQEEILASVPLSKYGWKLIEKDKEVEYLIKDYAVRLLTYELIRCYSQLDFESLANVQSKNNLFDLLLILSKEPSPEAYSIIGNRMGMKIEVSHSIIKVTNI